MTVGIKDIALAAGVSIATASRVIHGNPKVSPELRDRVIATISRMAYRPNMVARSLRMQRTSTVGVVVPNIGNPHFSDAVRAIQDAADASGYTLLIANSDNDPSREEKALRSLLDRQVDGVIVVPSSTTLSPALLDVLRTETPIVAMDRRVHHAPQIDHVTVDTRRAACEAVLHLVARGRSRVAFAAGPPSLWTALEKQRGYRDGLEAAGVAFDPALVFPGDYTMAGGARQAAAMLEAKPRPDAVVVANSLMALGVMRVLLRREVRIPEDIALIGYDDAPWTEVVRPAVSTIAQPVSEMGRQAMQLLSSRLAGEFDESRSADIVLPATLVVRESSGLARSA